MAEVDAYRVASPGDGADRRQRQDDTKDTARDQYGGTMADKVQADAQSTRTVAFFPSPQL